MQVSVHAAKTNLSKLIEAVIRGERVTITRNGVATVELVPARPRGLRVGSLKGKVAGPPEGVFAPMDEDELKEWGAG